MLDQLLRLDYPLGTSYRFGLGLPACSSPVNNSTKFLTITVGHKQFEEKSVQLCFRQRISTFLLDRVLRCKDHKRLGQFANLSAAGNRMLLHSLKHSGLSLGSSAVDFVSQNNLSEDGAALELELAPAGRCIFHNDIGADDIRRHQIRCKLDAPKLKRKNTAHRAHQQRLTQARHSL